MGTKQRTGVVVPAAGSGKRMLSAIPKQFLKLNGVPLLIHTLRRFEECDAIDDIIVVTSLSNQLETEKFIVQYNIRKTRDIVLGGEERQHSVMNGCVALQSYSPSFVMVHDAVRPFITSAFIEALLRAAKKYGAAIPVLQPKETIGIVDKNNVLLTVPPRALARIIQTPQAFRFPVLMEALIAAHKKHFLGTDESSVVLAMGGSVHCVEGLPFNIKITTQEDFNEAKKMMRK